MRSWPWGRRRPSRRSVPSPPERQHGAARSTRPPRGAGPDSVGGWCGAAIPPHPALQFSQVAPRPWRRTSPASLSGPLPECPVRPRRRRPVCGPAYPISCLYICLICAAVMHWIYAVFALGDPVHGRHQADPRILSQGIDDEQRLIAATALATTLLSCSCAGRPDRDPSAAPAKAIFPVSSSGDR